MHYGVLILIVIVHASLAKQSFDQEPQQREVNPGEEVVLPCRIYDKSRNSICSWQKNGFPISLQTGKYQWDGDRQRGDCSLRIFKADINFDNGRHWSCLVNGNFQSAIFLVICHQALVYCLRKVT